MTTTIKNLLPFKYIENTQTTQYTASAVKAVIDKATIVNITANPIKVSVNIVVSGDTAGNDNLVINNRTIEEYETYLCPELVGSVIESGGFISAIAGSASSLVIGISGREIT